MSHEGHLHLRVLGNRGGEDAAFSLHTGQRGGVTGSDGMRTYPFRANATDVGSHHPQMRKWALGFPENLHLLGPPPAIWGVWLFIIALAFESEWRNMYVRYVHRVGSCVVSIIAEIWGFQRFFRPSGM